MGVFNPLSQSQTLLKRSVNNGLDNVANIPDSVSKEMSKRGFSSKSAEWSRSKKFSELKIDVNFVPLKNQMRKSHEPAGGAKKPRQLVTSQQPPIRSTNVK